MTEIAPGNGIYPAGAAARSRWITALRGSRRQTDPERAYAAIHEPELDAQGVLRPTNVLFLTNTECPYRCLMCDLWKDTLETPTATGAIPAQIRKALEALPPAPILKLYNAGSFFDPRAIPPSDYAAIAALCQPFERVVVECHPAFIGQRLLTFAGQLAGKLEVAIGLETAHEPSLALLNKAFTLAEFQRKAAFLRVNSIDLRVFLLVKTPFMSEDEGVERACESIQFSVEHGATVCVVIPVRAGNGAVEAIAATTGWEPPRLRSLEAVQRAGIAIGGARVFADLWDAQKFARCEHDTLRIAAMEAMNTTQVLRMPTEVEDCC